MSNRREYRIRTLQSAIGRAEEKLFGMERSDPGWDMVKEKLDSLNVALDRFVNVSAPIKRAGDHVVAPPTRKAGVRGR